MTPITTHAADALGRMLSRYRELPNQQKDARVIGNRAQSTEDAIQALVLKSIADTTGIQLDAIGALVGQPRLSFDDATYQIWIQARVLVNLSSGTGPDLIGLLQVLANALGASSVDFEEWFPACFCAIFHGSTTATLARAVQQLVTLARAGGVAGFVEWSGVDDAHAFTLCGAGDLDGNGNGPADALRGLGCCIQGPGGQQGATSFSVASGNLPALGFYSDHDKLVATLMDTLTGATQEISVGLVFPDELSSIAPSIPASWTGPIIASPYVGGMLSSVLET